MAEPETAPPQSGTEMPLTQSGTGLQTGLLPQTDVVDIENEIAAWVETETGLRKKQLDKEYKARIRKEDKEIARDLKGAKTCLTVLKTVGSLLPIEDDMVDYYDCKVAKEKLKLTMAGVPGEDRRKKLLLKGSLLWELEKLKMDNKILKEQLKVLTATLNNVNKELSKKESRKKA